MPPETEPEKSPFTDEQLASLKSTVATIVNSAIVNRDKMADKKRAEDRAALESSFGRMIDELRTSMRSDGGADGDKKGKGKGEDIELQTLRRQFTDATKKVEEYQRQLAEEQALRRASALRQNANEILATAGIDGTRFKGAYALLQQDGKIRHSEDGTAVFVDETGSEVALEVGLKGWMKSEDAKIFLPPSGTKGAGTRPGQAPPSSTTLSRPEALDKAFASLGEALQREIP